MTSILAINNLPEWNEKRKFFFVEAMQIAASKIQIENDVVYRFKQCGVKTAVSLNILNELELLASSLIYMDSLQAKSYLLKRISLTHYNHLASC